MYEKMIDHICELIEIESISGDPEGEYPFGRGPYEALEKSLEICRSLGMRTKKCGNYTGYAEVGEGEKLVAVLAHLDVVPSGEGWKTPPFKGTVSDGRLYGRGALDDKGPAMAAVYAVKDLAEEANSEGRPLGKRIRIIFGCSEEKGEWKDMEYYLATEEKPDAGFTPDADFPLIFAEKGIAEIVISFKESSGGIISVQGGDAVNMVPASCTSKIMLSDGSQSEITGYGISAHGSTPGKGRNAIADLMGKIAQLNDAGKCSSEFAEFYMRYFSYTTDGSLSGCFMEDDVSGPITVNPGLIYMKGDEISLHLDVRYPVTYTGEAVIEGLREKMKAEVESGKAEIKILADDKPMYARKDSHLVQTLLNAYRNVTGDRSEPAAIGGGTYAKAMDNIVAFGPVFPGREGTEHQSNEYVEIDDLYMARKIYKEALKHL